MAKFRIRKDSLRRVMAKIGKVTEEKKRRLAFALAVWGDDLVAEIQQEILKVGAFDQGLLHGATHRQPVEVTAKRLRVVVLNELEYASVIEFGRNPRSGYPPLLPLVGWAKRHGIIRLLPTNATFGGQFEKQWAASRAVFNAIKNPVHSAKRTSAGKVGALIPGVVASRKPLDPIVYEMLIIRLIAQKLYEHGVAGRHHFSSAFDRKAATFRRDIAAAVRI